MKTNDTILDLICKNASVNEICKVTGLSHKQLFYRINMLKIKGYDFKKKYFYSGDIVYSLIKEFNKEENGQTIYTSSKDTEFKALLISDLHLGSIDERPELLFEVYNYAIKDGINIIINAGDLIDGTFGQKEHKITDINKQIEHLLKSYPFDKNILNFICLGNHDFSCLEKVGLDISKILDNKRHDLVSLGYGEGYINVKNDIITVRHPKTKMKEEKRVIDRGLILSGHRHSSKFVSNGHIVNLHLPSLSNMNTSIPYPSIVKMTTDFNNGIFNLGIFEHLIFIKSKLYKVSESQYQLHEGKDTSNSSINNEELLKSIKYNVKSEDKEPESNQKN